MDNIIKVYTIACAMYYERRKCNDDIYQEKQCKDTTTAVGITMLRCAPQYGREEQAHNLPYLITTHVRY